MIALRRKHHATCKSLFHTRPCLAHAPLSAILGPRGIHTSLCKTHRCHQKEFLLKFVKDRQNWRYWLFESRKRYGLSVLNYVVTSNHIHLLVRDRGQGEIAQSMQLIAGRSAQEYNQRKNRKGAFWEDRYHATAVDTEEYLARCMTYIDLNMVRAGVVSHPLEWDTCGYREIQQPPERYAMVDLPALMDIFGFTSLYQLQQSCRDWVNEVLQTTKPIRENCWTESLAVGRLEFIERVKDALGVRGLHRGIDEYLDVHFLKEPEILYDSNK